MKIIISPAKKMNINTDIMPISNMPIFLEQGKVIWGELQKKSKEELKVIWKCSDSIVDQNIERLRNSDMERTLTPAILSYEGIQYQNMATHVLEENQYEYIEEHLRILSGMYGVLRPFDGVIPYRLEMQARMAVGESKNFYEYWGDLIGEYFNKEAEWILNLASKEYSKIVIANVRKDMKIVTCIFGEEKEGKIIEKGTICKMARGQMVRYLAEHNYTTIEQVKTFTGLGFKYSSEYSTQEQLVFLKEGE